ncbi:MmgE/PrpD family protein [Embleya sp. NBC_00896]|uniref:MmgE/PrpD family protein n=1 Tax=Embleya sp. NBC_00896 TaxID=2975961 RepID=UPI00387027FE|nr:MmgE/PrpD family protein [Embleya sp. NBC_00896]
MAVSGEFADWATELTMRHVPLSVRRATCRGILEAITVGVGAARVGTVDPAVHVAVGIGGPPEAELIGHAAGRLAAPAAALANGMLIGAGRAEPDPVTGALAVVLPVALAVGQEVKARGDEVLLAVIAGHETACRLTAPGDARAGGLLGAALAAALLMALDRSRIRDAVGIAGEFASGPGSGGGTLGVGEGVAAGNAIIAARLAASGASGPDVGIDELCRARRLAPGAVLDGLGEQWSCGRSPAAKMTDHQFDLEACERLGGRRRDARALIAEIRALAFAPSLDSILALTVRVAAGT